MLSLNYIGFYCVGFVLEILFYIWWFFVIFEKGLKYMFNVGIVSYVLFFCVLLGYDGKCFIKFFFYDMLIEYNILYIFF